MAEGITAQVNRFPDPQSKDERLTLWELYERAAKNKYGDHIQVLDTKWAVSLVEKLGFKVAVINSDPEPTEKNRITADINMKEYINYSDKEVDETLVRVAKKKAQSLGSRYQFSATKGINWGFGGNIGAQVMGMAVSGVSTGISGSYAKQKTTATEGEENELHSFEYSYDQQEKICVSPMTKVHTRITSYVVKYEQGYTIKFSLPKSLSINVLFKGRWDNMCCGSTLGNLTASNLLGSLPGFVEEEDMVSFHQDGILSWVGEGSRIDKAVEPLLASTAAPPHICHQEDTIECKIQLSP